MGASQGLGASCFGEKTQRVGAQRLSLRPPTKRQLQVLKFIADSISASGVAPSVREILAEFGFRSTQTVLCRYGYYDALERRGLIARDHLVHRGVLITAAGYRALARLTVFAPERRCASCCVSTFTPVCRCGEPAPIREAA